MKKKTPPRRNVSRKPKSHPGELPQILVNSRGIAYFNYKRRRHYLGRCDSPQEMLAAEQERLRIVAEQEGMATEISPNRKTPVTVSMLVRAFLEYAVGHYVKHGRSTGSAERFATATQPLLDLYADLSVTEFKPLALKAVRQKMIDSEVLCRKTINTRIGLIKYIFKWGVGEEIVPPEVKAFIYEVPGLREGKTEAPDHPEIESIAIEIVMKTLPYCHPILADMILVQMHAGMRPQDVCNMRLCDIDMSGDIWEYTPWEHKTEHRLNGKGGKTKVIRWLGPKAQEILKPYVSAKATIPEAYLFSPGDAVRLITLEKRMARKTKVQPSQIDRSAEHPMIKPGERYKTGSYRNAIKRAAKRAGLEEWSPNRLRHTWATFVEENYGPEAARILLGHRSVDTTQIYIDRDRKTAIEIVRKIG